MIDTSQSARPGQAVFTELADFDDPEGEHDLVLKLRSGVEVLLTLGYLSEDHRGREWAARMAEDEFAFVGMRGPAFEVGAPLTQGELCLMIALLQELRDRMEP
jgi:hypothetical protein